MTAGGTNYCYLELYRNGVSENLAAYADMNGRSGGDDRGSNSEILTLVIGDRVWIQTGHCDFLYEYPYTSFSGFKI